MIPSLIKCIQKLGSRFAIITDDTVQRLYAAHLCTVLKQHSLDVCVFSFPQGEMYKTRKTKEEIEDRLFENGFGKDTCIIAMGGGVVLDIAGFIAATFCRKVPLVLVPTTLLAMVDASIGGKNGVDTPYGKNLIGTIYHPKKVFLDYSYLKSLNEQELRNGIVEMIKHGLIADSSYFAFMEKNNDKILHLDSACVKKAIQESIRIKKDIVKNDKEDIGLRRIVNFGHTIGHALEKITNFSIPHGMAVAIGIVCESFLSCECTHLSKSSFERIKNIFYIYDIQFCIPRSIQFDDLCNAMVLDKKSHRKNPRFVLLEEIGKPKEFDGEYCTTIDTHTLRRMYDALLCN